MKNHAWLRTAGPLLGLLCTWALFAVFAGPSFRSWANQELMLVQTAVVGTAAIGATLIIVSGGIDLSVGANIALSAMVGAAVLRDGHGFWLAALAAITTGCVVGWLIGALVTGALVNAAGVFAAAAGAGLLCRDAGFLPAGGAAVAVGALVWFVSGRLRRRRLPLSPFIVTLGLWGALRGLAKGLGDNQPIYFEADDTLADVMMPGAGLLSLPAGVWVMLIAACLATLLLRRSVFGRHVTAIGSSRETARLCGIDLPRTELWVYVLGCALAGVAAVLQLSYLSMGDPTTAQGYELKAIAAAVIGGASLAGGEGSVFGTLLGALIMTVVDTGCTQCELNNWVQEVVTGVIIVAAVALDRWRQGSS